MTAHPRPFRDSLPTDQFNASHDTPSRFRVIAPSRLHFGLLSFASGRYPFGGVGAMIANPSTIVEISPSDCYSVTGTEPKRVSRCVQAWMEYHNWSQPLQCRLRVVRQIPKHIGLGSGTQLALSVATALNCYCGIARPSLDQLVASVGRARRSSVGSWGFRLGGCIAELGHKHGSSVGRLHRRISLPHTWRFVLVRPADTTGLNSVDEERAFAEVPDVPLVRTSYLKRLVTQHLIPAIERRSFNVASDIIHEYGRVCGRCFSAIQGAAYASQEIADLIAYLRSAGVRGIGQTSWGPTVFALMRNQRTAVSLRQKLQDHFLDDRHQVIIARPNNCGAVVMKPRDDGR